jgi:hypothetical protein
VIADAAKMLTRATAHSEAHMIAADPTTKTKMLYSANNMDTPQLLLLRQLLHFELHRHA